MWRKSVFNLNTPKFEPTMRLAVLYISEFRLQLTHTLLFLAHLVFNNNEKKIAEISGVYF